LVGRASCAGARLDSDPDPRSERRRDGALYVDEVNLSWLSTPRRRFTERLMFLSGAHRIKP